MASTIPALGRVPVIVSTGHTGTGAAVALSREAESLGADAVMIPVMVQASR